MNKVKLLLGCLGGVFASLAQGEILFVDENGRLLASPYLYAHPLLPSVVFIDSEAYNRGSAVQEGGVRRAPDAVGYQYGPYVPTPGVATTNQPDRASNRDMNTYSVARAHAFSQRRWDRPGEATQGGARAYYSPYYPAGWMLYPPVPAVSGVNVPSHPSNRDNNTYNLNRAHSFSMDLYKR